MISGIYKITNENGGVWYEAADDVSKTVSHRRRQILDDELDIPELEGAGPFTVEELYVSDIEPCKVIVELLIATQHALGRSLNRPGKKIIKLSAAQIKLFTTKQEIQMSEGTKRKISKTMKGKPMSAATKQKISVALKKPKRKATCPHCNLTGGSNAMKRYHFDNCKEKTNEL
jgi:hypothetical protein